MAVKKKNVLVVYSCFTYSMRATTREHLKSFRNYGNERIYYLNLAYHKVPRYISLINLDLIIFHTLFLTNHWKGKDHFNKLLKRAEIIKNIPAVKVMLPQDEFYYSDLFCNFIKEFNINYVFSVAPENEWKNIYSTVNFSKVKFISVLTGYLDDKKLRLIQRYVSKNQDRDIDIGYRTAGKPYFWFGRHGFLKEEIAKIFLKLAPSRGLNIDISTNNEDAILGNSWYQFLARCKYTIGVESGTSMIDPDGSIKKNVENYLQKNPQANFEEVEKNCFQDLDNTCNLYAISPRHLEACATRTCQVLTKGEYGKVLKPGQHYMELNKDFSNINELLDDLVEDKKREKIVENAYHDIVASGKYTYKMFVGKVISESLKT